MLFNDITKGRNPEQRTVVRLDPIQQARQALLYVSVYKRHKVPRMMKSEFSPTRSLLLISYKD